MSRINIDRIINENINKFVKKVINESNFDYVTTNNPIGELNEYIENSSFNFSINGNTYEFSTESFEWVINYHIVSDAYAEDDIVPYDAEPSTSYYGEEDWYFDEFKLHCFTKDGDEVDIKYGEDLISRIEDNSTVDYDGYEYPNHPDAPRDFSF